MLPGSRNICLLQKALLGGWLGLTNSPSSAGRQAGIAPVFGLEIEYSNLK